MNKFKSLILLLILFNLKEENYICSSKRADLIFKEIMEFMNIHERDKIFLRGKLMNLKQFLNLKSIDFDILGKFLEERTVIYKNT